MTFKPLINETAPEDPKSIIEACLKDINYWMNINKLKLNNSKTELATSNTVPTSTIASITKY